MQHAAWRLVRVVFPCAMLAQAAAVALCVLSEAGVAWMAVCAPSAALCTVAALCLALVTCHTGCPRPARHAPPVVVSFACVCGVVAIGATRGGVCRGVNADLLWMVPAVLLDCVATSAFALYGHAAPAPVDVHGLVRAA